MENEKQNKPRTIQIKYPAAYSQSWTENQSTVENKKKSKVHNNRGQPHSQSFQNDRSTKRLKRKLPSPRGPHHLVYPLTLSKNGPNSERKIVRAKKPSSHRRPASSQQLNADPFSGGPWQLAKPKIRGPDSTAPHLKYGLFRPPKKNENKSQVMSPSSQEPKSWTSTPEHSSKKDKKLKANKGQLPEGETPMFVFRAIDPRYTRQLSVSAPTHVDIRPRAKPPLFPPPDPPRKGRVTPQTKSNSPTLSGVMSPKKSIQGPKKNPSPLSS